MLVLNLSLIEIRIEYSHDNISILICKYQFAFPITRYPDSQLI